MQKDKTCSTSDSVTTVHAWTSSDKGQKAIKEAIRQASESSDQLQASRKINPADMRRPFTV